MNEIKAILEQVQEGSLSVNDALLALKKKPYEDIGFAKVDIHRKLRQGMAEVIYGASKTPEQIIKIIHTMQKNNQKTILITRLSLEAATIIQKTCPMDYHADAKAGIVGSSPVADGLGKIVVATGGTSDIPVAEEAALSAEIMGNEVLRLYDVGVSGLHRLLSHLDELMNASVIIAIAGMEGALGYGASFGGVAALLSMLNSCASGVSVVNIDNGFGAGVLASRINHMEVKK